MADATPERRGPRARPLHDIAHRVEQAAVVSVDHASDDRGAVGERHAEPRAFDNTQAYSQTTFAER